MVTGPSVLYELTKEKGAIQGETKIAMERLQGWLFGPDGKQTCLYITLSELGRKQLHRVIGRGIMGRPRGKLLTMADESGLTAPPRPSLLPPPLDSLFAKHPAITSPLLRLGGPPVDNVAIDEEGQVTLMRLVGLSIGVGLVVSWISFRSVAVVLVLTFVGITAAEASVAFVGWSGGILDAVLMSMPSLVYVLGLSGAVHIVNYYRDTVFSEGYPGSPEQAHARGVEAMYAGCPHHGHRARLTGRQRYRADSKIWLLFGHRRRLHPDAPVYLFAGRLCRFGLLAVSSDSWKTNVRRR